MMDKNAIKLSRILHAGYLVEVADTRIAFDPIFENPFSRNCHAFPAVSFDSAAIRALRLDAVFISHYHDDHCSLESLDLLPRTTPIYIFCVYPELLAMIRRLGFTRVESLRLGETIQVGDLCVTTHAALDVDVDSIFQIQAGGLNILNVVDSWIGDDTFKVLAAQKWDVILWPFQTMREIEVLSPRRAPKGEGEIPHEWFEQLRILNPNYLVPSSCQFQMEPWSWYNRFFFPISYARFTEAMHGLGLQVVRMDPGESFKIRPGEMIADGHLPWVRRLDQTNVDYSVDSALIPTPTSDIAKRFPKLEDDQTKMIVDFCGQDLPRAMVTTTEPYFYKKRKWRLVIFDHEGRGTRYDYLIEDDKVFLEENESEVEWLTEIPAFKLHAALTRGESLTSLYLRINDVDFAGATETRIADADIMEDPLIRVLFQKDRFAYQSDQLRRIEDREGRQG